MDAAQLREEPYPRLVRAIRLVVEEVKKADCPPAVSFTKLDDTVIGVRWDWGGGRLIDLNDQGGITVQSLDVRDGKWLIGLRGTQFEADGPPSEGDLNWSVFPSEEAIAGMICAMLALPPLG